MNIPCKFCPLGNGGLPPGYMRVAYLQPAVSTASFDSDFYGTPDLGCRARGFLDTSRASLFPSGWFLFISDKLYWTSLCYYLSKNAIGYRDNNKVLYPQQDELPDVESGGKVTKGCPISGNFQIQYNWLGEKKWTYMDADKTLERTLIGVGRESYPQKVYLLGRGPESVESWSGGVRDVLFSKADRVVSHIVPVLNQQGQPAMWDLIRKQSLKKAGEGDFIVGIETQSQFNNFLHILPDRTGQNVGTLQVRLADNLQTVMNIAALDALLTKNWEISQAI